MHLSRLISQWFTRLDPTGKVMSQIKRRGYLIFIICKIFRAGTKELRGWDFIQKSNHMNNQIFPKDELHD